jgi:altronate dehydratase small subunit
VDGGKGPDVDAISLSPADNVATALRAVKAGERLRVRRGQEIATVVAMEPIPLCHKVSLNPIDAAAPVIKYGHPIGAAAAPISAGAHVHVHNMRSARARGSVAAPGEPRDRGPR